MTPTERRRPVTRRRRLAHIGIGGVLAAVAGSQAGALIAGDPGSSVRETATPIVAEPSPPKLRPRPVPKVATRSVRVPRPTPRPVVVRASSSGIPAVWGALVRCEAGRFGWRYGAPGVGTDPGYDFEGGPNFVNGTWLAYGGGRYAPHAWGATPVEQIIVAERVLRGQGVRAWPECGPKVHLTPADASLPVG